MARDADKQHAKTAPAGKDIQTESSYPHIYENADAIKWNNQACNSKKVNTHEFPISHRWAWKNVPVEWGVH